MTQPAQPTYPTAVCPSDGKKISVQLGEEPGSSVTVLCPQCGKLLLVERGNRADQLVVKEQATVRPVHPD